MNKYNRLGVTETFSDISIPPPPKGFSRYPLPPKDDKDLEESSAKKIKFLLYHSIGKVSSLQKY